MAERDEGAKLRGAPGTAEAPGGTGHMSECRQDHVREGYASAAPAAPHTLPFRACPSSLPLPFPQPHRLRELPLLVEDGGPLFPLQLLGAVGVHRRPTPCVSRRLGRL